MKENLNNKTYYILLILTDGIIKDFETTISSIIEASELPISIIIIGIGPGGNNGFKEMEALDSDKSELADEKGRKAKREVVQCVDFEQFGNAGEVM